MLKSISWTGYLTTVIILLAVYYLIIGMRYFSGDIKALLTGKRKLKFRTALPLHESVEEATAADDSPAMESFEAVSDDGFNEVEHLIERLKTVIADASKRKLILQEFKQYLSMVLKEYPSIKYSPLRPSVNELIISECQKYGAVTLIEEEVELLWKEAV